MIRDEGYIKFKLNWEKSDPVENFNFAPILEARKKLYSDQLIGAYFDGIGFGNISQRHDQNQFVISGSATGNIETLHKNHFTLVTDFNIEQNTVQCHGPIQASSESMSHAVVYQELSDIQTVIHIHNLELWKKLLHKIPTTNKSAAYGTPEMAHSIVHLIHNTDLKQKKIFVMEGHEEGVFVFGETFEETLETLYFYY